MSWMKLFFVFFLYVNLNKNQHLNTNRRKWLVSSRGNIACGRLDESDVQRWIKKMHWSRQWWNFCLVSFKWNKDDYMKETNTFPMSYMIWGPMSFKGPGVMATITSTINAHVYIQILDTFLIPLIENWFLNEVIFQDSNILSKGDY